MTTAPTINQRRILIAVDGSSPSQWALAVGFSLAEDLDACVLLVHAVEPLPIDQQNALYVAEAEKASREMGRELLDLARAKAPFDVPVETQLLSGPAAFVIVEAAATWRADFIVLGSHGHGRVAQLFIGSTTTSVIRRSLCPVIAVAHEPQKTRFPAAILGKAMSELPETAGSGI